MSSDQSKDAERITTPQLPAADSQGRPTADRRRGRARSPGGQASKNADMPPAWRPLSFRRIVDVPFETCLAALDPLQRTRQEAELRLDDSLLQSRSSTITPQARAGSGSAWPADRCARCCASD